MIQLLFLNWNQFLIVELDATGLNVPYLVSKFWYPFTVELVIKYTKTKLLTRQNTKFHNFGLNV